MFPLDKGFADIHSWCGEADGLSSIEREHYETTVEEFNGIALPRRRSLFTSVKPTAQNSRFPR
ncbi:hypothetical protein [Caldimonas brevitalea]|uniref:hypothetical protein n=1 Tax=Caldimonas brevitalea TaxID=413882 RepID=UPI0012FA5697|nr:hypothetical protein [Caldimonas brevitalea]